jgi:putative nucleotidyltransferase with HDIG domain
VRKYRVNVFECKTGEILAEDIVLNGTKMLSKNTILNSYILNKLINYCKFDILIYDVLDNNPDADNYKLMSIEENYKSNLLNMKSIIEGLVSSNKMDHQLLHKISDTMLGFLDQGSHVVKYISLLGKADEYTYTHCINVAFYGMIMARWMKLPIEKIKDIVQAGLLHDIGKVKIPNDILNKPSRLSDNEFYEMKKHTIYGYDIITSDAEIGSNVKDSILMHHERIDGSGYPLGLHNKDIPQYAKIISVADVFDAMTSNRVYKKGTTPFRAFKMFLCEGLKIFDTTVLFTFLENLSAYYIGMQVVLDSGDIGEIVYIPPRNVLSPIIKVNNAFIDFSHEDISRIQYIL